MTYQKEILTEEQQNLFNYIKCSAEKIDTKGFSTGDEIGKIILNAPAGTGKTFFIKYLIKNLRFLDIQILAPTHKAKGLFLKDGLHCQTIHRFLNSTSHIDEETGEIIFNFNQSVEDYDLIIVDECSMVSKRMAEKFINMEANILFVGDDHQLPPVKESLSLIFDQGYRVFPFTKNMRITVNPDSLSAIYLKKFRELVDKPKKKIRIEHRVPIDFMIEQFKQKDSDCVCLAWTNVAVLNLNKIIRSGIFNISEDKLKPYYVGERLVFSGYRKTEVVTDEDYYDNNGDYHKVDYLKYYSSSKIEICELNETTEFIDYHRCEHQKDNTKIKTCSKCGIKGHNKRGYEIQFYEIIDQNGVEWHCPKTENDKKKIKEILADFKYHCKKVKNTKEWIAYYDLKNKFYPDLFYTYSMTIHKSQGSQWSKAFVDIDNIRKCRDVALVSKLSYTAVSRFKEVVHFI